MLVHVIKPPELLLVDYCLFVIWRFMIVVSILLFSKKINNNKKLIIMNFTFFGVPEFPEPTGKYPELPVRIF